jgi:nicotinamidase-related amidase
MTITKTFPPVSHDNTALVIVDMQKDFLEDWGACFVPGARSVVRAIASLLESFRAAGLPVIHVHTVWQKDGADMSRFTTSEILMERGLRVGDSGTDPVDELTPRPTEYVVHKIRYSAFYGTELESLLRSLGVVYVVTVGVATNYCVDRSRRRVPRFPAGCPPGLHDLVHRRGALPDPEGHRERFRLGAR